MTISLLALSLAVGGCAARAPLWAEAEPGSREAAVAVDSNVKYAILGGGCFWCLEAVYELVPGVLDVVSGYAGGSTDSPTYAEVCTGETGHAEVVRIAFDPRRIGYDRILEYFWEIHDPTSLNRQGADIGSQYRSVIFYADEGQREIATASMAAAAGNFVRPIVTELLPEPRFWEAESYHQDYFRNNPDAGYCRIVIAPKLRKAGF
jgi:peptide-methionine (S)-S-oxide reductase